jgi:hypothetical protein
MPWRICGPGIAGVHVFPLLGFLHQAPCGQSGARLMMVPSRPLASLISRPPGCALAASEAGCEAMFRFGHPRTCPWQGGLGPRLPTHEAWQRQASLAKTIRKGCDVVAVDVRQQAPNLGVGVLSGSLTWEETPKGLHEGVEAWHALLEALRGHLTCVQPLALAPGVSRVHGALLLCRRRLPHSQKGPISHKLEWVNPERQANTIT